MAKRRATKRASSRAIGASGILDEISSAVRQEIMDSIQPSLRQISQAVEDLERALKGRSRRGAGRRAGGPGAAGIAKRGARRKTRTPRGALKGSVENILMKSKKPVKIAEIRDKMMRTALFKNRNPKVLYAQVVHALKTIDGVIRAGRGEYRLSARAKSRKG